MKSQLIGSDKKPLKQNALQFLIYGLMYAFATELGRFVMGITTAHSALPLSKLIVSEKNDHYVWAFAEGDVRGQSITPLYQSVPFAASRDKKLHELLALSDALHKKYQVTVPESILSRRVS